MEQEFRHSRAIKILGIALIVIGIILVILPFLPGLPAIAIGAGLAFPKKFNEWRERMARKFRR
ncbi:hypothetical protein HY478_00610 [Candidatus Uhrbacteria bacterium]|nr:hypothetical protein [Candidatus Uhrbacteria bacterium]